MLSRGLLSAAVLVTALVAALTFPLADRGSSASSRKCAQVQRAEISRAATVTGSGDDVLVIGDSWSAGWRLARPAGSWPVHLPGRVHVDGFPGSGFSAHASSCGRFAFAERVAADVRRSHPRLVVLQGGLNDFDQSDAAIAAGFHRVLDGLTGRRVVVVGPASAPRRARQVPHVDALLRGLSAEAGVPYVSTTDLVLPYLPDRLHLTPTGHRTFGQAVAARVRQAVGAGTPGVGSQGSR